MVVGHERRQMLQGTCQNWGWPTVQGAYSKCFGLCVANMLFVVFLQPFKNIKTIVSRRTIVYSLLMPTLKSLEDQVGIGGEDQEGRDKNDIKILSRQVGGGRNTKILTNMYCLFTLQQDVAKPLASTFSLSFNNGLMNCLLLLEPF